MVKVFDYVNDFKNGMALVKREQKYNFLTRNGDLLMDKWVDHAGFWKDGYCPVFLGQQLNFINQQGECMLPIWASITRINDTYRFVYEGVPYTFFLDALDGSLEFCKGLGYGKMTMLEFLEKVVTRIVCTYTGLNGSSMGGKLHVVKNARNMYNFIAPHNVGDKVLLDEWATSIKANSPEGDAYEPKFVCTFIKDGKTMEKLITAYEVDDISLIVSDLVVLD